jgi:hypothetical protein
MTGRKRMKDAGKKKRFLVEFQRRFPPVTNKFKADGIKSL